jgi:hypothetical protein
MKDAYSVASLIGTPSMGEGFWTPKNFLLGE